MEDQRSRSHIKWQKQLSRALAILVLIGVVYAGKTLITDLDNQPTSVEGHAPLKTNVKFQPVEGEPTVVDGYSSLTGSIDKVIDGDTIDFISSTGHNYRLRLLGIDAPELQQGDSGRKSKGSLQKLISSCINYVTVIYNDKESYDPYGRLLGKVLCEGKDINLDQIKLGHAWVSEEQSKIIQPQDRNLYASAENTARSRKLGLWAEDSPEAPWMWRLRDKTQDGNSKLTNFYNWIRMRLGF